MNKLFIILIFLLAGIACTEKRSIDFIHVKTKSDLDILSEYDSIGLLSVTLDSLFCADDIVEVIKNVNINNFKIFGKDIIISKKMNLKGLHNLSLEGGYLLDLSGLRVQESELNTLFISGREVKNLRFVEDLNIKQTIIFSFSDSLPTSLKCLNNSYEVTVLGNELCDPNELLKLPRSIKRLNLKECCMVANLGKDSLTNFLIDEGIIVSDLVLE